MSSRKFAFALSPRPTASFRGFPTKEGQTDAEAVIAAVEAIAPRAVVRNLMVEYLLAHGSDEPQATFDLLPGLFGPLGTPSSDDIQRALQLLESLRLASVVPGNAAESPAAAVASTEATPASSPLALRVFESGTNSRAVATGYALKLLAALDEEDPTEQRLVELLETSIEPATAFFVREKSYANVPSALSALAKTPAAEVEKDEILFEVAEGLVLYNKAQYWALLSSGLSKLDGKSERAWWDQLTLLRRLLLERDFGAFFVDACFLPLASRFLLVVPEAPENSRVDSPDETATILSDLLERVDRANVLRFLSLLQFYEDNPKKRLEVIRLAKRQNVLRAITDAMHNERTPIKVVDYCLQVLTTIAQSVASTRRQEPHFFELFGENGAGDLLDSAGQRGEENLSVASIITRYYLHRRDAWVVLSYVHPSFIHINERLVQESIRRAVVTHDPPSVDHTGNYKAHEDLLMVASSMVILSHAITNPNAKAQQLIALRPVLSKLLHTAVEAVKAQHSKIPGWNHQQRRLVTAAMRVAVSVAHHAATEAKTSSNVEIPRAVITDCVTLLETAEPTSTSISLAAEILRGCCLLKQNGEHIMSQNDVDVFLNTVQRRFVDSSSSDIDEAQAHYQQCNRDALVEHVASTLADLCVHRDSLVAGSILMSLGLQQYEEWAVPAVRSLRQLVETVDEVDYDKVQPLAASLAPVCVQALQHADVTAVKTILAAMSSVLQKYPAFAAELFQCGGDQAVLHWLKEPLLEQIEEEGLIDLEEDEIETELSDEERSRRAMTTRNGILRGLFETLKALSAHIKRAQDDDIPKFLTALTQLTPLYLEEVPNITNVVQCLNIVVEQGIDKAVFEKSAVPMKQLLRQLSETSKANNKICAKLCTTLLGHPLTGPVEADKKKKSAATTTSGGGAEAVVVSAGETSDRMEYLRHSDNKFQLLVAAPSQEAKRTGAMPDKIVPEKVGSTKKAPPPPKGFVLIKVARHQPKAPAAQPVVAEAVTDAAPPAARNKKIRDAASRQKDALRRDNAKRTTTTVTDEAVTAPATGGKVVLYHPFASGAAESSPAAAANKPKASKNAPAVKLSGDGINVDMINVVLDDKRRKKEQQQPATGGGSQAVSSKRSQPAATPSWASMAKNAKSREEREADEVLQARLEEERLQKLAAERQAQRQREQEARQEEERRKVQERKQREEQQRLEQEAAAKKKGNRAMPLAIGGIEDISQLSAALQGILPAEVHVKVSGKRGGKERAVSPPAASTAAPVPPSAIHHREPQGLVPIDADPDQPQLLTAPKPLSGGHTDPWEGPLRALGIDDDDEPKRARQTLIHDQFVSRLTAAVESKPQPAASQAPPISIPPPRTSAAFFSASHQQQSFDLPHQSSPAPQQQLYPGMQQIPAAQPWTQSQQQYPPPAAGQWGRQQQPATGYPQHQQQPAGYPQHQQQLPMHQQVPVGQQGGWGGQINHHQQQWQLPAQQQQQPQQQQPQQQQIPAQSYPVYHPTGMPQQPVFHAQPQGPQAPQRTQPLMYQAPTQQPQGGGGYAAMQQSNAAGGYQPWQQQSQGQYRR